LLKEIIIAIQSYAEAHRFVKEHKLIRWIIIPGIIYALFFLAGMYFFSASATGVIEYLTDVTGASEWIQSIRSGWIGFLFTLSGVILWLVLLLFYFSLFKYVWLILGAPVFAYLSEKTDASMEGKEFTASTKELLKDSLPGMKVAIRNCLWQILYFAGLILLCFVPVIGMIAPVIALFVECYYYGFSMIHYSLDRKKIPSAQSVMFINNRKGLAIGNGLVFYLMHILIIFAPAYAIIAATLSLRNVKIN